MMFESYLLNYLHMCRYLAYFEMIAFFFVYSGTIVDIQVSGYICTFGNDKADEESFDFSSAFIIAIFICSLCKSIRERCAR